MLYLICNESSLLGCTQYENPPAVITDTGGKYIPTSVPWAKEEKKKRIQLPNPIKDLNTCDRQRDRRSSRKPAINNKSIKKSFQMNSQVFIRLKKEKEKKRTKTNESTTKKPLQKQRVILTLSVQQKNIRLCHENGTNECTL